MFWYISIGIIVFIMGFIIWRYTSVARGARQRDEKILSFFVSLENTLKEGRNPTPNEIGALAINPATRSFLYQILTHFKRLDLFSDEFKSEKAQAESVLVYWMMHPNELQDQPHKIELLEIVEKNMNETVSRFYVFRYQMADGHWAGNAWILGLAGPFTDNEPPYSTKAMAFSRSNDKQGEITPTELVDWFIGMLGRKIGPVQ